MVIDIDLPDGNGLDLMDELRNDTRGKFVVITGDTSQRAVIKSIRHRAVELLIKPVSLQQLRSTLAPNRKLTNLTSAHTNENCWIRVGSHQSLVALRTAISYCAEHGRGHALIIGESGVEKPAVAREVHRRGRRLGRCIVVDCSQEKGGASTARMFGQEDPETGEILHAGYIDQAAAGTLVLDYVEHLSIEMQSRLMSLLDSGSFRRVDGVHGAQATLAILGIAREDDTADGDESKLRSDFLFRLAKTTLKVPSLSECRNDIEEIAYVLLHSIVVSGNRSLAFSDTALDAIRTYKWKRNIRELRSVIQRSAVNSVYGTPVELISLPSTDRSDGNQ
jgi:DNA-binding NtrC family response regulator